MTDPIEEAEAIGQLLRKHAGYDWVKDRAERAMRSLIAAARADREALRIVSEERDVQRDACEAMRAERDEAIEDRRQARDDAARAAAMVVALRAQLAAVTDCGQEGVCAIAPGCVRHWHERNREIAEQLAAVAAERDEARRAAEVHCAGKINAWAERDRAESALAAAREAMPTSGERDSIIHNARHAEKGGMTIDHDRSMRFVARFDAYRAAQQQNGGDHG